MQATLYILYGISLVAIVLGFIALLKQKTYIDSKTNKVTEVSLPIFGKMKTNYPSLLFLATGISLAFFVFSKSYDKTVEWKISGRFVDPNNQVTDFSVGDLTVVPGHIESRVTREGKFEIKLKIKDGVDFEDAVESIDYSCMNFSANILPKDEQEKKKKKDGSCLLNSQTATTRNYKPVSLNNY